MARIPPGGTRRPAAGAIWAHMHMRTAVLVGVLLAPALSVAAAQPDANALVRKMRDALEPPRASTRKVTIVVNAVAPDTATVEFVAGQARKKLADGRRLLTVVLAPENEK